MVIVAFLSLTFVGILQVRALTKMVRESEFIEGFE
jgi:hypothetical protein